LDQAIAAFSSAVSTDPQFALGYAGLGEAYRLKYQLDKNPKWTDLALVNATKTTALNGSLPSAYVTLGRIHDTLGNSDLALSEFEKALQLDPRNAEALTGEALSYEHAGRIADSETAYKKAIALRPDYWNGYNSLGNFYDRQGKYDDAIKQLQHAIELTPDNATAYSNLGATYIDTGDAKYLPQAESALKKSVELAPSYGAYANLGDLYLKQKRYSEAAETTEKALQMSDKDFIVWANLVVAYEGLKVETKAEAALNREQALLEQATQSSPRDAAVQYNLGTIYARKKQPEKALSCAQAAMALAPDDPSALAGVGEIYERLGDRKKALESIEKALEKGYPLQALKDDPTFQSLLSDPKFRPSPK
jgi:eukaryotic-like serine/threonine-protein kinase